MNRPTNIHHHQPSCPKNSNSSSSNNSNHRESSDQIASSRMSPKPGIRRQESSESEQQHRCTPSAGLQRATAVYIKSPTIDETTPSSLCSEFGHAEDEEPLLPVGTPSARSSVSSIGSGHGIGTPYICSPNPSPPASSSQLHLLKGANSRPLSASVTCRTLMSALLKQQNSIAEEDNVEEEGEQTSVAGTSQSLQESVLPQRKNSTTGGGSLKPSPRSTNWLSPPEVPSGGNISPPPQRTSPLPKDVKEEVTVIKNETQPFNKYSNTFHSLRSQQKQNRKGSLSPNNSLRYSATMMAATRRNQFQQQRTVSEATPATVAQRDQVVAEILGKRIHDCYPRYSAGCVTTGSVGSSGEVHCSLCSCDQQALHCKLLFKVGGDSSSASSLNNVAANSSNSNASSMHSLSRGDSSRRRNRVGTIGSITHTSEGIPRLVALIPQAFPPVSSMLSAERRNKTGDRSKAGSQVNLGSAEGSQHDVNHKDKSPRPQSSVDYERLSVTSQHVMDASLQAIGISPAHQQNLLTPIGATLSPLNNNSSSHRRENPARYNFSITKQRSSSESAFCLQKQKGVVCDCPGTQHTAQCQAMSEPTRDAHGNELLVDGPFSSMKRRLSIAFINPNREQVILQKILGPTGLGWLKKGQHQADGMPKKSTSLLFSGDDIEAQKVGNNISAGGQGSDGGNKDIDDSCSVKQPLVKEEDAPRDRGGRLIRRQHLYNSRRVTCDYALAISIIGIVLMVLNNEFTSLRSWRIGHIVSAPLHWMSLASTAILVGLVIKFHYHEIQIFMNANSAEDWKIALTLRRCLQISMEILICGVCPIPIDLDVYVTSVASDGRNIQMKMPLNTFFSIIMFFRLYWGGRVMLLHSRLFTDAASRSIAGLNRVKTDSRFILKTMMTICPGQMLMIFTASLWVIGGYILRLCERQRYYDDDDIVLSAQTNEKHQSYFNSLWLIAVTFLSIGYGDIVPNTQCGRIMSVVTGILGTCTSSMVVAVIARKLELTRAEKHVHNFMTETKHTKELKHIAANVIRETWLIYKSRQVRLVDKIEPSRIRYHQRKFLVAICALRKLKTKQRKLEENRVSLGDVAKTTSNSHDLVREVHSTQEGLALRLTAVEHQLSDIQRELGNVSDLLRCLIRPYDYPYQQQQSQSTQQSSLDSVKHIRRTTGDQKEPV